jgi:hypothetical protein
MELWPTTTTTTTTTTITPITTITTTNTATTTPTTNTITNDNERQLNFGFIKHWPCLLVLAAHFGYHLFRRVRKTAKIDYQLRHVCPSVRPSIRMEQLGSHWSDFHDI